MHLSLGCRDPAHCTVAATVSSSTMSAASTVDPHPHPPHQQQQWYVLCCMHLVMIYIAFLLPLFSGVCVCVGYSSNKVSSMEMEIPADLIIRIGESVFPLHKVWWTAAETMQFMIHPSQQKRKKRKKETSNIAMTTIMQRLTRTTDSARTRTLRR